MPYCYHAKPVHSLASVSLAPFSLEFLHFLVKFYSTVLLALILFCIFFWKVQEDILYLCIFRSYVSAATDEEASARLAAATADTGAPTMYCLLIHTV